ncbi:hypothetical protein NCAS_0J00950 [Naumovozyma castellii]|uniref:Uncharacterized protein n=1 Tax=Naumovozyma castellii TaxID=27288 RepID=G0VKN7_NAUCA|nr:hypothetical protein NCAS_0J00950 [Naumovozyma castellii CBS 4309]CCC72074.1 hypothetical protein NCAS_0J00950 [Naumovozyma castellii CBS 4309]
MTENNNNNNNRTEEEKPTVCLRGGGKVKVVPLEQLRRPHAVSFSPNFMGNSGWTNNSGGLVLNDGHRPSVEVNKKPREEEEKEEEKKS